MGVTKRGCLAILVALAAYISNGARPAGEDNAMEVDDMVLEDETKVKVATLNTLAVLKSRALPTGMPTFYGNLATKKKTFVKDTVLPRIASLNIDIIALQEIDQESQEDVEAWARENRYEAKHTTAKVTQAGKLTVRDSVYLLVKNPILSVSSCEETTLEHFLTCSLTMHPSGRTIVVKAGHADVGITDSEAAALINVDILLGDMNMKADKFIEKIQPSEENKLPQEKTFDVYPTSPDDYTMYKSQFPYRKLAQAVQNTVSFQALPDGATCDSIQCSDKPAGASKDTKDIYTNTGCCYMPSPQLASQDLQLAQEIHERQLFNAQTTKDTCKYAARVCFPSSTWNAKNVKEEKVLLNVKEEGVRFTSELKKLGVMIGCKESDKTCEDEIDKETLTKLATNGKLVLESGHEDYIAVSKPAQIQNPYLDQKEAILAAGRISGFPSSAWLSDHLLVVADVVFDRGIGQAEFHERRNTFEPQAGITK